jgi:trigger factor
VKSSVENLSETRVKLTVEIPFEDLQDSLKQAYKRIGSQVNVPGFRRGKIPARIIDQRFGRGVVLEEVINAEVPKAYDAAVAENTIKAMGQPEIEVTQIEDGELISFTAEVDVTPQFDLPEDKGIEVEVKDSTVTDEEVEEQVEQLQKRFASTTPVERAVENGDLVLVDVKGELDGEELEDFAGSALNFEVGADGVIDGFNEAVLGKSEGDSVTFEHTPEEGPHTGKAISVTVDIKGVRERNLPAVDDEFAMMASEFDTMDELRADLRTKLQGNRLVEQAYEAREKLAELLLELVDFPLPERFLQGQLDEHFADGHGDDEHRAQVTEETRTALKTQLILDAIADAEELQVGQGELIQWLMQQAPRYGMSPDQFASALAEAGQVGTAMADVRRGKALAFVMEAASIKDASGNPVDLTPLDEEEDDLEDLLEEELEDEDFEDEETVEDEVVDEALEDALDAIDEKLTESRDEQ